MSVARSFAERTPVIVSRSLAWRSNAGAMSLRPSFRQLDEADAPIDLMFRPRHQPACHEAIDRRRD